MYRKERAGKRLGVRRRELTVLEVKIKSKTCRITGGERRPPHKEK